ncbi:MAG: hypothetical protein CML50_17015 [Rhodobacteraceae bacterium]|nr:MULTISPECIES: hypothetical protein [Salipiger]MAB07700.1 hypothetical protein [Paracoccaceae bacterium]GFZ97786.1 hypothetical protein GCM10011326_06410 [Salipiger profundus]SFC99428.1 hypothetical protein SAMN05444415_106212 [Salipiger profundus]
MSQIDDLQSRITRALDRIAQGVERVSAAPPAPEPTPEPEPQPDPESARAAEEAAAEIARLTDALDDEKMANAQLEERVRELHARLDGQGAPDPALQDQLAAQRDGMATLDSELQRLRTANTMLVRTNEQLRTALQDNLGEPHLVNQAMLAELEALRAARAVEEAEARAVLGALEPALAQAAGTEQATGGETMQ